MSQTKDISKDITQGSLQTTHILWLITSLITHQ